MKTINAKQLRARLEETFDEVSNGQDVIVTYRSKSPIRITSTIPNKKNSKNLAGLAYFDTAPKKNSNLAKNVPLKELYDQTLQVKYGNK